MKCEACVGSVREAKRAFELGADRVELCADLEHAGTTPSLEDMEIAGHLNRNVNVIIRPTPTFTPDEAEFQLMKKEIAEARNCGLSGVVLGLLNVAGEIDEDRNRELCECAEGLHKTFHMAFDCIQDQFEGLETLIRLKFDTVLTKGGSGQAVNNLDHLRDLVVAANGRISIMAGGSVTNENRDIVSGETGCEWVHGRRVMGNLDE